MEVSIPFYKFRKLIEKTDNENFNFKHLIFNQIETFKKMVKDYILDKCEINNVIDLENKSYVIDDIKKEYGIIFNPSYKVKLNDIYEVEIKSDILIKKGLLRKIFHTNDGDDDTDNFVHVNILYKTLTINKKGEVSMLSKYDKLNQALLYLGSHDTDVVYIGRKYKKKDELIDNCFGVYGISKIKENYLNENIEYLISLVLNKQKEKKECEEESVKCSGMEEINPVIYRRKFKYELKEQHKVDNSDIHNLISKTIFLDFEFVPDLIGNFDNFPKTSGKSVIFMIGIGYIENGQWVYKHYTTKELEESEENIIINNWLKDIKKLNQNGYKYIMHWSKAEKTCLKKEIVSLLEKSFVFVDLMDLFKMCQVKNIKFKSLSLKHISKIFNKFKLIDLKWDDTMPDGKSAMVETLFCNLVLQNKKRKREKKLIDFEIIKTVMKYNEIDVKMMFLILEQMTR